MLIKKYPNGPMSTYLHDMNIGQPLSIRGPIPKYKWEENKSGVREIILILDMKQSDLSLVELG